MSGRRTVAKGQTGCWNVVSNLGAFPTQVYNRPPRFYIAVHTDADLYAPPAALPTRPRCLFCPPAPGPGAILLDSARPGAERGRFDLISAWPVQHLQAQPDEDGRAFLERLRASLAQLGEAQLPDGSELPFVGGLIGYLSYDFGRRLEQLPQLSTDDLGLADAQLGLYAWALLTDHQLGTSQLVFHQAWRQKSGLAWRHCSRLSTLRCAVISSCSRPCGVTCSRNSTRPPSTRCSATSRLATATRSTSPSASAPLARVTRGRPTRPCAKPARRHFPVTSNWLTAAHC